MALIGITLLGCVISLQAEEKITIAYLKEGLSELNQSEKQVALQMWSEEVAKLNHVAAEIRAFDSPAELIDGVELNQINFALLNTGIFITEYPRLKPHLEPEIYAVARSEELFEDYLILVKKNSPIKTLANLRAKRFAFPADHILYNQYLTHLISHLNGQKPRDFFKEIISTPTQSQAILKVFFGGSDACLVPRHVLMTAAALNPALFQELEIIHYSGPIFIPAIIVAFNSASTEVRSRFGRDLMNSQKTVRGKQILDLFQIDHLDTIDIDQLRPTFAFFK